MPERLLHFASLTAGRDWLQHPVSRQLVDYYSHLYEQGLAESRSLPRKSDIDPSRLRPCLPHMAVMDCDIPVAPRYRLAGESYIQLLGANPTGKPYLDFVPAERHAVASAAYVACMDYRCGMLTRLITTNRFGHEIACEVVNLPVSDDGDTGRARYLYITLVPQQDLGWILAESRYSQYREVRERGFVDLGHGIPDTFAGRAIPSDA